MPPISSEVDVIAVTVVRSCLLRQQAAGRLTVAAAVIEARVVVVMVVLAVVLDASLVLSGIVDFVVVVLVDWSRESRKPSR